ncbi:hypothetical protein FO519_010345 [Halicephalobus sp. NKZ332]|nr:hypothetical protein FO519_010345 [Halicephalobus sp. NKZ332]
MSLCKIPISSLVDLEIDPTFVDDIFIDEKRKVTIGRETHLYLPRNYFEKLCQREGIQVKFNLNIGFDKFINAPMSHGIDHILDYLIKKAEQVGEKDLKKVIQGADIVCARGCLLKLAHSPYKHKESWKFGVEKFNDVLFIRQLDTEEEKRAAEKPKNPGSTKYIYWGHKFKSCVFTENGKASLLQILI